MGLREVANRRVLVKGLIVSELGGNGVDVVSIGGLGRDGSISLWSESCNWLGEWSQSKSSDEVEGVGLTGVGLGIKGLVD